MLGVFEVFAYLILLAQDMLLHMATILCPI